MVLPLKNRISKPIVEFILVLLMSYWARAYGTSQEPDILIYDGKSCSLLSNPLESYKSIDALKLRDLDTDSNGNWHSSTANWRGYIAKWAIINDTLYLTDIIGAVSNKHLDLPIYFPEYSKNGKIWANWYSGELRIGKGDVVSYIHMGYMSQFSKEILIEIESGLVTNIREFSNSKREAPGGFVDAATLYLRAYLPKTLALCHNFVSDTICFCDLKKGLWIFGVTKIEPSEYLNKKEKVIIVETLIDSLRNTYSDKMKFDDPIYENQRYGYAGWIDGASDGEVRRMRIFVISNNNSQCIVKIYVTTDMEIKKFLKIANTFSKSVMLTEFP